MGVRPMPDVAQGTLVQEHRRSEVGVLCANTRTRGGRPGTSIERPEGLDQHVAQRRVEVP